MHEKALDVFEEHRKRRVEQEKQDKDSWEPGKLRGLRRRGWAWMKQHADLGLAWMNGHACCFPDLGSAELMLVVQACLPACHVFMVWLMAWASGDWQSIPVSAQGTVMQGRAMLAFQFLAAVFMAWSGWDSHTRLKQLGRSKEQIRAKRQAAAKLFGILALVLGFVFLLELGLANALARLTHPASPRYRPGPWAMRGAPPRSAGGWPRGQELGGAAGPQRARFAPVLRPRSGREAAAKGPAHLENTKITLCTRARP